MPSSYQAAYSPSLDAIYQVKESGRSYLFSQMEPIAARMALPSFDEPLFKTPFDITIITAAKNKVVTNTAEVSRKTLNNGWIKRTFATTEPLPTYLLAFAVGEFDIVEWTALPPTSVRDFAVPLRGIAAQSKGEKIRFALANTQAIVEALERYFGTPYPYSKLDLIAAPDFSGAMENAGAIVYSEFLLLMEENAPLTQLRAYGEVHAHELAHQWFGNLVTPKWWDDIWLNEALATWISYKAAQQWRPELEFDRTLIEGAQWAMQVDARSAARQIRNPIDSNGDIMNAFDGITYQKGGGVLQMFENYVGKAAFRKGVQLHMQRFAHGTADINDFLKSIADGSANAAVIPAFESFLYQSSVPEVNIEVQCAAEKPALQITQTRYVPLGVQAGEKQRWQIPLCYKTDRVEDCELITKLAQTVALDHCPQWVMPNRDALITMVNKYLIAADAEFDPKAINPNLIAVALSVAIEDGDKAFVEQLKSRALKSTDAVFRDRALNALTHVTELEFGKQLMSELLLSPQVRTDEVHMLVSGFIRNPLLERASWHWVKANFNKLIARYSAFSAARLVSIGGVFCDSDTKQDMQRFFSGVQAKIPGSPRKIKEAVEVVNQCIALQDSQSSTFRQALESAL